MFGARVSLAYRSVHRIALKSTNQRLGKMNFSDQEPDQTAEKPRESLIRNKLESFFEPKFLEVINESKMHNVPRGSETHFKVVIVSDRFKNEPLLSRHRLVNKILEEELKSGVHALSIIAKTPDQWDGSDKLIEKSPPCQGGMGR